MGEFLEPQTGSPRRAQIVTHIWRVRALARARSADAADGLLGHSFYPLGLDRDEVFPKIVTQLSGYLPPFLNEDGTKRFAVYHKSLSDWLIDTNRRGGVHIAVTRRGHENHSCGVKA